MKRWGVSLFMVLATCPGESRAQTMAPIEVFKRCYSRMTRSVPQEKSALYQAVAAGTKSAEAACLEVFDRAAFGADMVMRNRTDVEAKRVLKTFHDLHQSWFQIKDFPVVSGADYLIDDVEEPALYFTRAAFAPAARFDSVVKLATGLRGVRDQLGYPASTINKFDAQRLFTYRQTPLIGRKDLVVSYLPVTRFNASTKRFIFGPTEAVTLPTEEIQDVGELVGVKTALSLRLPSYAPRFSTTDLDQFTVSELTSIMNDSANFELKRHFGGGVLGSQTFFMENANLAFHALPDGYKAINRRFSARVFEDLLCHQLPTLAEADISSEVNPNSTYTFQKFSTCMACHSSIDGLGLMLRGFVTTFTSALEVQQDVGFPTVGVVQLAPVAGSQIFAFKPPAGRLHYRENLNGARVSMNVSNFAQVGNQFAAGNDLYTCAAKRYYKFFTGVEVNLRALEEEGSLDRYHQDNVVRLAQTLKTKQSVRALLSEIFNSEVFHTRNYMTVRPE